jgi:hypothetical protein
MVRRIGSSRSGVRVRPLSAGDVNGDGFGDLVVGAPCFSNGEYRKGRACVYLGSATGPSASAVWMLELDDSEPEVRRHIVEIRAYIESAAAMLPNAIVLAFRPGVTFAGQPGGAGSQGRAGTLRIPLANDGEEPIGFVVDGRQRLAAIRDASIKQFPVFAVAFIAPTEAVQREQFLLVNSVKPLPRGLIHELRPGVEGRLGVALSSGPT